jgi:nucleoside-diphosphate-sugar epimerase
MLCCCVTGATGFLATHLIQQLLAAGHCVRGTVRSLAANPEVLAALRGFDGAAERLALFEADLLAPADGRFATALAGCEALLHTATPVIVPDADRLSPAELEAAYCSPAVDGTRTLLEVAAAADCAAVVLTASTACFLGHPRFDRADAAAVMTADGSTDSDEAYMRANGQWYRLAKTLQEGLARELAPRLGLALATIHPSLIVGPYFGDAGTRLSAGHASVLGLAGADAPAEAGNGHTGVVHVQDVAAAHIALAGRLLAGACNGGRYLLNQSPLWSVEAYARFVGRASPLHPPSAAASTDAAVAAAGFRVVPPTADCGPARRDLGIVLRAPEGSLRETVASLAEKGLLAAPRL